MIAEVIIHFTIISSSHTSLIDFFQLSWLSVHPVGFWRSAVIVGAVYANIRRWNDCTWCRVVFVTQTETVGILTPWCQGFRSITILARNFQLSYPLCHHCQRSSASVKRCQMKAVRQRIRSRYMIRLIWDMTCHRDAVRHVALKLKTEESIRLSD